MFAESCIFKIIIIWSNIQNTMKEFYDWLLKYALSSRGLDFGTHVIYVLYMCVLVTQLCPALCNSLDCSPLGSSVHGLFQARILEWVAIPDSRGSSYPRDWTWISHIALGSFTIWPLLSWVLWEILDDTATVLNYCLPWLSTTNSLKFHNGCWLYISFLVGSVFLTLCYTPFSLLLNFQSTYWFFSSHLWQL